MTRKEYEDEKMHYVEELRERLKGQMDAAMFEDNNLFLRFLIARNFDLNAAETMLRNHIHWRKVTDVDSLLTSYSPPEVAKYIQFTKIGHDKEGAPVHYLSFENLDAKGILKSMKPTEISNFFIHQLESDVIDYKTESAKRKTTVDKSVFLFNVDNLPLSLATHKPSLELAGKLLSMYEANFPERLKMAIVFNASWYFTIAFAVVKHVISAPTLQKTQFFGKNGWKEELLKHIDADVIPAFLGGTRTDPDGNPMCHTILPLTGLVPERYFIVNNKRTIMNQPGVKKLTIHRFSKTQIEMHVLYSDTNLEWEFEAKEKDIAFSLMYKQMAIKSQAKELIPKQRVDTSMSAESGMFKCNEPGIYILEFDNSYSWIHHKEVYYKVEVKNPVY